MASTSCVDREYPGPGLGGRDELGADTRREEAAARPDCGRDSQQTVLVNEVFGRKDLDD
jgi:hypothetical protein